VGRPRIPGATIKSENPTTFAGPRIWDKNGKIQANLNLEGGQVPWKTQGALPQLPEKHALSTQLV
jgi:hypothetical protein